MSSIEDTGTSTGAAPVLSTQADATMTSNMAPAQTVMTPARSRPLSRQAMPRIAKTKSRSTSGSTKEDEYRRQNKRLTAEVAHLQRSLEEVNRHQADLAQKLGEAESAWEHENVIQMTATQEAGQAKHHLGDVAAQLAE